MDSVNLIREQIKVAHEWFEGTMGDVTDEVAHRQPGGNAHPIGSRYAHLVVSEDIMVNNLIQGGPPLFATTWAGRTGLQDPQAAFNTTLEWAQGIQIDLKDLRRYAQAVYANTEKYLASLPEEDLEGTIDLTNANYGKWSLGAFLITFVLGHVRDIMGEISALKGVYGLQGYLF
jgi:hypothetical protein